jgi:glutamine amidotransferase
VIAIVDYGVGNLRSVQKALERAGATAVVSGDPAALDAAHGVVLPGVGAFGDGMANLRRRQLVVPILRQVTQGKPFLGICLGMQLLFEESEEMGEHRGLGLVPGRVVRFSESSLKVPHVGWNQLHIQPVAAEGRARILDGIGDGAYAYFVHSYYVAPADPTVIAATTDYGIEFAAVVGQDRVWGAQFHPEKSQETGLRLLANFVRQVEEASR